MTTPLTERERLRGIIKLMRASEELNMDAVIQQFKYETGDYPDKQMLFEEMERG